MIFGLAIAFSIKAVATSDWISAALSVVFFTAHHIERFFSASSVEAELKKKVADVEEALRLTITEVSHVKMSQGITSNAFGGLNKRA